MPTLKSFIDQWFSRHIDDREDFNLDTDFKVFDLARFLRSIMTLLDTTGLPPASGSPIIDPVTFAGAVLGEVGYLSGNSTLSKARGDVLATARAYGAFSSNGNVAVEGVFPLLFESGLTLAANNIVYLSNTTAGRVTNVAPVTSGQYKVILGLLKDPTGYNIATGSALPVNWWKVLPALIP